MLGFRNLSGVMAHTINHSIWETDAGGSLSVSGQLNLYIEFQDSQDYIERPCHKTNSIFTLKQNAHFTLKKVSLAWEWGFIGTEFWYEMR